MPTYREDDPVKLKKLRDEEESEREFYLQQMESKKKHELDIAQLKAKNASEKLRITHRATSRASIWRTFFMIIPKSILIISWFWLIVFHREVPESWGEYLSS